MIVKATIEDLIREEREWFTFLKKQINEFCDIKRACENVAWDDELYNQFVVSMNEIGKALSTIIQTMTNGRDVFLITEFIPFLNDYLETGKEFPIV